MKLTGDSVGGQPQPCHAGKCSGLGYQERPGRGMGGQVSRILKIQGRERDECSLHVLCERSSGGIRGRMRRCKRAFV